MIVSNIASPTPQCSPLSQHVASGVKIPLTMLELGILAAGASPAFADRQNACLPHFRSRKTMKLNGRDIDFMTASLRVHQFPPQ
jgi:hypothetical protein